MKLGKPIPTMMTAEARGALDQAGFSRRDFLKSAGALIVSFRMAGGDAQAQTAAVDPAVNAVDSWIAIGQDERVTGYVGKCEFGQGFRTVQHQLFAEELGVPLDKITLVICDTGITPDQGVSSGSQGHPTQFGNSALRQALATARDALFQMASRQLNVPADQLDVVDGVVFMKGDTSKAVTYGQLIGGKKLNLTINAAARPKDPKNYTVLGTSVPRYDVPEKVFGIHEYVQNVRLPGMRHGKVVRPPMVGAKIVSVDEGSVAGLPGNVKVVRKNNFLGVVADTQFDALNAAEQLKVDWTTPDPLPKQAELYAWMRRQPVRDAFTVRTDDVDDTIGKAAKVIRATYLHPYQMHGSIAASCAVADVQGGSGANAKARIWSATQGVYPQRDSVARVLDIPKNNIRVTYVEGSGCYGCNGNDTVSYDAALLSQGDGKPVRVQYTRADEMAAAENYGPAYVIDLKAGLDDKNNMIAWDYEAWTLSKGGRPAEATPGNIVTGELVGFEAPPVVPAAGTTPTAFGNNGNSASSYGAGVVGGRANGTGTIRAERVLTHTIQSPFFTGPLRSPNRLQNTFANESFIDEVAASVKADPVEYRLRHLSDQRLIDVLNAAAKQANWDARPSPKAGNARTGVVTGRGVATVLYEGNNGYCALVAEVSVDQATGAVTVTRLVSSADSGPTSNPNGLMNQMEGGALQGMSRAMREEVRWDDQSIISTDWRSYPVYQFGQPVPKMESVIIDRKDVAQMGAGECTITIAAAAIANAIFDATGARIRQVPFTPARVLEALRART